MVIEFSPLDPWVNFAHIPSRLGIGVSSCANVSGLGKPKTLALTFAAGLLTKDYDVVCLQETFLLHGRVASAANSAKELGFFSSFEKDSRQA
eukprot:4851802-Amphidinium_carterae.1